MSFPTGEPDAIRSSRPSADARGFVLGPDAGDPYWWLGTLSLVKLHGRRTAGGLDIVEHRVSSGYSPPPHVHEAQDEVFYVIGGRFAVTCGDQQWTAGPGSLVFLPRGVPHGFTVDGDGGRTLLLNTPAGFADLITDLGQPATSLELPPPDLALPDPARIAAASQALGIHPA